MKQTRRQRLRRKTKRRRRRGGAKIGEGVAAKVYYPAIPCVGMDTSGYVSKVFDNKQEFNDAKMQIEDVLTKLSKIDPNQNYFLYPIFCETFGQLTDENRRDGITEENKVYSYLVKKGGRTVESILLNTKLDTHEAKIKFLKPIVEEATRLLSILNGNGLQHNDFHPGNMLQMEDASYRIIDFDTVGIYRSPDLLSSPDRKNFIESASALLDLDA